MQDQPDQTTGQLPNSAGEIEDAAAIPTAPVHPESREVDVDPEVEASYAREEQP